MQRKIYIWVANLFNKSPFFFVSLCVVFWWLGTDSLTWKRISIPLAIGGYYFWKEGLHKKICQFPLIAYFPILISLYTVITPGYWFDDFMNGYEMLSVYLVGIMAVLLLQTRYAIAMIFLPISLSITYIAAVSGIFSIPFLSEDDRLVLFLKHPNILGGVSAVALLFLITYRDKLKGIRLPIIGCMICLVTLILLLSANRSAYFGVGVSLFFLIFHFPKKRIFLILSSVLLVSLCALVVLPSKQFERMESLVASPLNDKTFESRKPIWETAVAGIEQSPWFGHSIKNFKMFHHDYVSKNMEELNSRYSIVEKTVYHPHNIFIGLLFMYGIVGTALFLLCMGVAFKKALKQRDTFFQAVIIFYITFGLFEFPLDREDGILMLFFPLGLVYGREIAGALQRQSPTEYKQPCGAQAK